MTDEEFNSFMANLPQCYALATGLLQKDLRHGWLREGSSPYYLVAHYLHCIIVNIIRYLLCVLT